MARAPRPKNSEEPPAETIGLRAAEVIEHQRTEIRTHLGAALDGRDPEGVHDMRVASRRLRACLQLFTPWIEPDDLDRTASAVRSVTRALGRVRELDVMRLRLVDFGRRARPERALALEALDSRLEQRRSRARAKMMARFAKVDLDRLDQRLRRLVAHLEASGKPPSDGTAVDAAGASGTNTNAPQTAAAGALVPPANATAFELVRVAAPDIEAATSDVLDHPIPDEVGSAAAAEELHGVRIAAKKLRYLLEVVTPYLDDAGPALVKRLKRLQDGLGDFHDDIVLDGAIAESIDQASLRERTLLARELRRFRALRRRALARDERAVRATLVALRDGGFAEEIRGALAGATASVVAPEKESPATQPLLGDPAADATEAAATAAETADAKRALSHATRRRAAATVH
jgi:CHAD domain-containing protein